MLIFISISFSQVKDSVNSNSITKKKITLKYKDPSFAGLLSAISFGFSAGQFYNKEYLNGGIRAVISAGCIIAFVVSPPFNFRIDPGGGTSTKEEDGSGIKVVSVLIFGVNWFMSIVDASYSAHDYNKKLREKNNSKFEYGLSLGKFASLKFSYKF